MAIAEFDTKAAIVVRDDLAVWQRLNVAVFLASGIVAAAGPEAIGEPYRDADEHEYLALLVQPALILEADAQRLQTLRERACGATFRSRSIPHRCSRPAMTPRTALRSAPFV